MAFFNYVAKEITLKVVYYGPGLSGKTTNLQHLYEILDPGSRGKFISLATEADRTLFFDFLPVELGKIKDFSLRFQLYTVPGQIRYNATRKLVLKGADAVVFVADSQREMRDQNVESFRNMRENLVSNNIDPDSTPVVLQFNKRDLPDILTPEELNADLNDRHYSYLEAEAVNGKGVKETFKLITEVLLKDISRKHKVDISSGRDETVSHPSPQSGGVATEEAPAFEEAELSSGTQERPGDTGSVLPEPILPHGAFSSLEKLDMILDGLDEITNSLSKMRDTLSSLAGDVNETKKQQSDLARALRDTNSILYKIREKRSWFRFMR